MTTPPILGEFQPLPGTPVGAAEETPSPRRWHAPQILAAVAAAATLILTGVAFWLSFEHLHDVAHSNGLGGDDARAWAWPATVDLFIIVGEVLMLRSSLRGEGVDWWAVALMASGSVGSIALNVAAVPPVAALLAFGALMRQIHTALAARIETATEAAAETETAATEGATETTPNISVRDQQEPVSHQGETPQTETETPRSPQPRRETSETKPPRRTPKRDHKVAAIGDLETETQRLLDLMHERGSAEKVSLSDAITVTGRPKATAAKRLKAARDLHAKGRRTVRETKTA
jgi:hypothetical protein